MVLAHFNNMIAIICSQHQKSPRIRLSGSGSIREIEGLCRKTDIARYCAKHSLRDLCCCATAWAVTQHQTPFDMSEWCYCNSNCLFFSQVTVMGESIHKQLVAKIQYTLNLLKVTWDCRQTSKHHQMSDAERDLGIVQRGQGHALWPANFSFPYT